MNEHKHIHNEFKSAGVVLQSESYYMVKKNNNNLYDVLGGKSEPCDNNIFDTILRECFEESDGLIDLNYANGGQIIKKYIVPDAKYIVFVINHTHYKYNNKKEFASVTEGILEWLTIEQIIETKSKERFPGILTNILTEDYDKLQNNPDNDNSKMLVSTIFKNIPLNISYHTLNKIYDLHINRHNELFLLVYKAEMGIWKHNIPYNKYKLLMENRGTIYHYNDNNEYMLIAYGLDKFWRHDDVNNTQIHLIDWNKKIKVQMKYDGFNYKVYYFKDQWHVSTNSSISCANIILRNSTMNALCAFNECANEIGFSFDNLNKKYTYVFEMIHPDSRLVVPYKNKMLIHLTTRDNVTLQEIDIDIGVLKPECVDLKSENEILQYVNNLSFEHGEGCVLIQESMPHNKANPRSPIRIKYKSMSYKREHTLLETHMYFEDAINKYVSHMWFLDQLHIVEKYHPHLVDIYNYLDSIMEDIRKQYDIMKKYDKKYFYAELKKIKNKFVGKILIKLYEGAILTKGLLCDDKNALYQFLKKKLKMMNKI